MKKTIIGILLFISLFPLIAEDVSFELGGSAGLSTEDPYLEGGFSDRFGGTFIAGGDSYKFDLNISMINDGKYPTHSTYQLGHYFFTDGASASLFYKDVSLLAGRSVHEDVVDTPYSIFINPNAQPVVNAQLSYVGDIFSYQSRWIRLNERSAQTYIGTNDNILDRGMTFHTYSFKIGDFKVGFEDSEVYLGRSFDAESFLSPLPMYVLEMLTTSSGRPWSEVNNTNSLMGFFGEYEKDGLYLEGQILVDDINASVLAPVLGWLIPSLNNIENLSKLAWSLGGHYDLPYGRLGFYHGGALKYTFQSTYTSDYDLDTPDYSTLPYDYSYYPFTEFNTNAGLVPLDYTENYIGYTYGENNISFLADYETELFSDKVYSFDLYSSLEWVLNGSKSPSNPWAEYNTWTTIDVPYELLSDDVIEHTLSLTVNLSKAYKDWLFSLDGSLGYVLNRLELTEVVVNEPKSYVPQEGNNHPIASLSLGVSYIWDNKE